MSKMIRAKPTIHYTTRTEPLIKRALMALFYIFATIAARYPVQTAVGCVASVALITAASYDDKEPLPYSEARVISPLLEEELEASISEDMVVVEEKPAPKAKKVKPMKRINDTAPTTAFKNPQAFLKSAAPLARKVGKKYNVPASIILAQALVESAAGTSYLAVNANNYFGHKCMSKSCRKGHCINRADDTHKDFFVKYPSMQSAFEAHAAKISSGRYESLKRYGTNYKKWAAGLKKKGYATDPNYAYALINTIEKYGLTRYN